MALKLLKGRGILTRLQAGGVRGVAKEQLLERAKSTAWIMAPAVFKDILSRCRVVFTVYGTVKEIPGIDPVVSEDVRLLNYVAYREARDPDGNVVEDATEVYVLGLEDLGITLPDESVDEMDDWKDLIVSIRYHTDYRTDPPTETILLTFQVTYTNVVVYLDDAEVFKSEAGTATPSILTVLKFDLEGNLITA